MPATWTLWLRSSPPACSSIAIHRVFHLVDARAATSSRRTHTGAGWRTRPGTGRRWVPGTHRSLRLRVPARHDSARATTWSTAVGLPFCVITIGLCRSVAREMRSGALRLSAVTSSTSRERTMVPSVAPDLALQLGCPGWSGISRGWTSSRISVSTRGPRGSSSANGTWKS